MPDVRAKAMTSPMMHPKKRPKTASLRPSTSPSANDCQLVAITFQLRSYTVVQDSSVDERCRPPKRPGGRRFNLGELGRITWRRQLQRVAEVLLEARAVHVEVEPGQGRMED